MTEENQAFSRLKNFPITYFAIVMGLSGLTIALQKGGTVLFIGPVPGVVMEIFTGLVFIVIASIYIAKTVKYPKAAMEELNHPVKVSFCAAVSISLLLLSIIYGHFTGMSKVLFIIGTAVQTLLTFYTIAFWINRNMEIIHSSPAWFIPVVGNIIVPVAGAGHVAVEFLMFYYSVGMFFWVILTAILINRIIFHNQLPQKFIPTLAIFIAPPSVAVLAYAKMFGRFDVFSSVLLNLGIFFCILLFVLGKNFYKIKFFISWWAFTFPLAALTLALMSAYEFTGYKAYLYMSAAALAIAASAVIIVASRTCFAISKKEICIEEK